MNETVKEWVDKAEGDWRTANREISADRDANYDAVCFHSQQCVEKLLKAILIQFEVTPPRTHHLVQLCELLEPVCKDATFGLDDLRFLTRAGVAFRYPGESADQEDAVESLAACDRSRVEALKWLEPRE